VETAAVAATIRTITFMQSLILQEKIEDNYIYAKYIQNVLKKFGMHTVINALGTNIKLIEQNHMWQHDSLCYYFNEFEEKMQRLHQMATLLWIGYATLGVNLMNLLTTLAHSHRGVRNERRRVGHI
ncbi:hypothetical protein ACJX0J_022541, partial [Zea mays]